eukprot:g7755.t1
MILRFVGLVVWVLVGRSNGSSNTGGTVGGTAFVGDPSENASTVGFPLLPNSLTFFMLGDFGGAPGTLHNGGNLEWKHQVAERMGLWATALRPRFVVGLGDNFYDVGVETAEDPAWDDQFESVYSAPALRDVPWLMCLGNHDYIGNAEAQMDRTLANPNGRWQMPSRAYSRKFFRGAANVEVFSVDTNAISYTLTPETAGSCPFAEPTPGCSPRFEEERARVETELERLLAASTATWKVLVGHHPLYSAGHHGSAKETAPLRAALLPLIDRYGVDLYACGHDHIAQHVVPTGGGVASSPATREGGQEDEEEGGGEEEERRRTEAGEESTTVAADTSYHRPARRGSNPAAEEGGETGKAAGSGVGGVDPGARQQGAQRTAVSRTADHVTIGTSGPMMMPGQYDFGFENAGRGLPQVGVVGGSAEGGRAGGTAGDDDDGGHGGGDDDGSHHPGLGFELWYASKRRAFGVVEASEVNLRDNGFTSVGELFSD